MRCLISRFRFFAYRAALFYGMRIASWFMPRLGPRERRLLAVAGFAMIADDGRFMLMARPTTSVEVLVAIGGHAGRIAVESEAVAVCSALIAQITPSGKPN